jgi:hypothetical protein
MRDNMPAHLRRMLDRLKEVRPTRDGWDALCPCADHNKDGDQHASLRVTLGDDGRVLIVCRVGCPTDAVLDALGMGFEDLFAGDDSSEGAANNDRGGASSCQGDNNVNNGDALSGAVTPTKKADPDLSHRAYEQLLKQLPLTEDDRQGLRRRGLSDAEIDRRGYGSLRNVDRGRAARAVYQALGDAVLAVPGFAQGDYGVTLHGTATGLLVPVRDLQGRVVALKVRRATEPKYVYLTGGDGGPSPGSPVHVPLGVVAPSPSVRVTEGELKADVCVALDGTPTVGVPGVTQWRGALEVLKALAARTVIIAFDAPDVHTKAPVFEQAEALWRALEREGFATEVEDWNDPQGP